MLIRRRSLMAAAAAVVLLGSLAAVGLTPDDVHVVVLSHLHFDHAGWNPDEFVGYRCVVDYPLWRCAYHAVFDFTEAKG